MRLIAPLPPPLPGWHAGTLLATWFGAGRLRPAPGTWGSLAALPCAAGLVWLGGPWALACGIAVVFAVGVWASGWFGRRSNRQDSSIIVIDEVAGQWMAILPVALDLRLYVASFVLFRLLDILKPWPISWIDRRVHGGFGVMADDILAGAGAALAVWGVSLITGVQSWFPDRWPI